MRLETEIENSIKKLAHSLAERGWMMTTAESCTGGWIAKACTDRAGSSGWFDSGFVTYSNHAKQKMLGVSANVLEREGAVSEAAAIQMAEGARRQAGVQAAVAVTGIAGPGGGSENRPVGTVWFGYALDGSVTQAECLHFGGDRASIRLQTVAHALQSLASRVHVF